MMIIEISGDVTEISDGNVTEISDNVKEISDDVNRDKR